MDRRDRGSLPALHAVSNRGTSIHDYLPPEILIMIFAMIEPVTLHTLTLMLVCKTWRYLILATPEFWVALLKNEDLFAVGLVRSPVLLRTLLARSFPRPIELPKIVLNSQTTHNLTLLEPHFDRITSLTVVLTSVTIENMRALLDHGMKVLVTLNMTHCVGSRRLPTPWSFSRTDILPRLQMLRMSPSLVYVALPAPSLEKLVIDTLCHDRFQFRCTRGTSMGAIVQSLRQYPLLKHIAILAIIPSAEIASDGLGVITLPNLRTITIRENASKTISSLLTPLRFPPETVLKLSPRTFSPRAQLSPSGIPSALNDLSVIATITAIELRLLPDRIYSLTARCYAGGTMRILIVVQRYEPLAAIGNFLRLFTSNAYAITSLNISIANHPLYPNRVIDAEFERALAAFPHLTNLTARFVVRKPDALVKALSSWNGDHSNDGLETISHPGLRTLTFEWFIPTYACSYDEYVAACKMLRSTLTLRKKRLGRPLELFKFTFRRYGKRLAAVCKAEAERERLIAEFSEVADEVIGEINA